MLPLELANYKFPSIF